MQQRSLAYQPALDGVRAVAVALVVVFHAGVSWLPAGYLGVSVFFTLSGYLITSLLLAEHDASGRVAMGAFYGRRVRRLLPASLLCIAALMVARLFGAFSRVEHLRADIVGALLQVFNWVRLAGSSSYADLFAGGSVGVTSPLEHYWSLAIEEQFYWVWPVVLVALVRWATRTRRSSTTPVLALTVLFAFAAPLIAMVFGPDAAYWATPARLAELLVGATLACALRAAPAVPRAARHLAAPALAVIVLLACLLPNGRGIAFHGALPLFALVSGALIWSLQTPGPVRSVLSWQPLVWLGRISYGVYLFHWPVDVVLRERGWKLASPAGFVVATAITLAISVASFVVVERPIRLNGWSPRRSFVGAGVATACLVPLGVVLPAPMPFIAVDHQLLTAASIAPVGTGTLAPLQTATTTATTVAAAAATTSVSPDGAAATLPSTSLPPAPTRPVRVLVVGDSTSLYLAQGLAAWSVDHPSMLQADVLWHPGVTLLYDSVNTSFDSAKEFRDARQIIAVDAPETVTRLKPDIVLVVVTLNDVVNRRWSKSEGTLTPFDARYRQRLVDRYRSFSTTLLASGASQVLLVVAPTPFHRFVEPERNDPTRYAVQHDVIREVAAGFGASAQAGKVGVVELDQWFTDHGHANDTTWRPDGVHLTTDSAHQLAADYLGATLLRRALGFSDPPG